MSESADRDELASLLQVSRIITVSLAQGILLFLLILLFIRWDTLADDMHVQVSLLNGLAIALTVAALVANVALLDLLIVAPGRRSARDHDGKALLPLYQTRKIIGLALLEGPALFAGVVFLLEGGLVPLILMLVALVAMLAQFPTRSGVEDWLEEQRRLLAQEGPGPSPR